ncbi:LytR/AlgR family response regulator transcription factor [Mariniflexile ostreae]|uniref:LytR/AlgR family response regulator transcription factor n=1 Tax=Mariniflexile ostreae TaxID=1520892 RepID=A0ABV5FFG7_9FLAO
MEIIKCLIIDDEPLAINVIKKHLENFDHFEIVNSYNNPVEAINVLTKHKIDLIFLDINMPKLNGIEFIKNLKNPPFIIITTAYREHAVESFELNVVDYLVKPIALNRFIKALHKVSRLQSFKKDTSAGNTNSSFVNENDHFFVKVNKKIVKIYFDEIFYIESLKDYVSIKTIYGNYIVNYNLLTITKLLSKHPFIRIHRSYTVATNKVDAIDGNFIYIQGKTLPIGRRYAKEVKSKILDGFV